MKKLMVFNFIFLVLLCSSIETFSQTSEEKLDGKVEQLYSTEGIEIDSDIESKTKNTKIENKIYKKEAKNKNKYLKNISKLKRYKEKQRINEKNLNYLKNRLDIQKNKLEELTSEESEKGE